jgi:hypothetical protein
VGSHDSVRRADTLAIEPRLDAVSTAQWYLFGSPELAPILEFAYRGSAPGPQVESQPRWTTLGMESHLTRRLFGSMVRRIGTLVVAKGVCHAITNCAVCSSCSVHRLRSSTECC